MRPCIERPRIVLGVVAAVLSTEGLENQATAQCELEKLVGSAAKNEDNSGESVSASGNVVVVGTPDGIFNTGSVFVFRRNGATWLDKPYRGDRP